MDWSCLSLCANPDPSERGESEVETEWYIIPAEAFYKQLRSSYLI